jgi:hypothetical protein
VTRSIVCYAKTFLSGSLLGQIFLLKLLWSLYPQWQAPAVCYLPLSILCQYMMLIPIHNQANSSHNVIRRPSIDSQRSISTTVSSLFRRATGRSSSLASPALSTSGSAGGSVFSLQQQHMPQPHDNVSVYSRPSFSSGTARSSGNLRSISRQPSEDSLMSTSQAGSTSGSVTNDVRGVMTRHRMLGGSSVHYASSISSRATTRSAKPPSSFHLRQPTSSPQILPRTHEDDDDEDHPKSAAELREEIENVESEGRKLLDAFNGLELTALTKSRAVGPISAPLDGNLNARRLTESTLLSTTGSSFTLVPERTPSMRKQTNGHTHAVPLISQPINLKRKPSVVNSIAGSFMSSTMSSIPPSLHSSRSSPNLLASSPPPMPALPIAASSPSAALLKKRPSIMRQKQSQSIQTPTILSRAPHTTPPVPVSRPSPPPKRAIVTTDPALHALEAELADIRRRKADVSSRYERRLDFLRAKLKSAEIRERLSKR